jgi:hypothetical protein
MIVVRPKCQATPISWQFPAFAIDDDKLTRDRSSRKCADRQGVQLGVLGPIAIVGNASFEGVSAGHWYVQ